MQILPKLIKKRLLTNYRSRWQQHCVAKCHIHFIQERVTILFHNWPRLLTYLLNKQISCLVHIPFEPPVCILTRRHRDLVMNNSAILIGAIKRWSSIDLPLPLNNVWVILMWHWIPLWGNCFYFMLQVFKFLGQCPLGRYLLSLSLHNMKRILYRVTIPAGVGFYMKHTLHPSVFLSEKTSGWMKAILFIKTCSKSW